MARFEPFVLRTIRTADCPDLAIREEAENAGLPTIDILAMTGTGDTTVVIYLFDGVMVASTNGNPVWASDDPDEFAGLADRCGLPVRYYYSLRLVDGESLSSWADLPGVQMDQPQQEGDECLWRVSVPARIVRRIERMWDRDDNVINYWGRGVEVTRRTDNGHRCDEEN